MKLLIERTKRQRTALDDMLLTLVTEAILHHSTVEFFAPEIRLEVDPISHKVTVYRIHKGEKTIVTRISYNMQEIDPQFVESLDERRR